jgi:hypothetical protein
LERSFNVKERVHANVSSYDGNRQLRVADLIGLDIIALWSEAVSEPLTGEHWADLSVHLWQQRVPQSVGEVDGEGWRVRG